jgi:protein TonB
VHFTVSTDGEPQDLNVTGADPKGVFDDAALEAVRRWRYKPTATPSDVDQRIRFKLAPAAAQ